MADIFSDFFIHSFVMSVFILLLILFSPVLSKRYSNQSIYYLWVMIAVGLMLPFKISFFHTANINQISKEVFYIPDFSGNQQFAKQELIQSSIDWFYVGFFVWIIGIVFFVIYHLIKYIYFFHTIKRWSEKIICESIFDIFEEIKQELGIKQEIQIKKCSFITSPMGIGFHKFFIFLPVYSFSDEELYFILKHELIHYKRKDLWFKILLLIINAFHWFNPFVYMMKKRMILQCELCCDSEIAKNMIEKERLQYVETMIHMMKRKLKFHTILANNFLIEKNSIKRRVYSIMDNEKKKKGVLCTIVLIVCMCLSSTVFGIDIKGKEKQYESWEDSLMRNIAPYSVYGVTYNKELDAIFYNGERVRGFVDMNKEQREYGYSFRVCFRDKEGKGSIYIQTKQNASGEVIGIEPMSEQLKKDIFEEMEEDEKVKNPETSKNFEKEFKEEIKENFEEMNEMDEDFKEMNEDFEDMNQYFKETKDIVYYTFDATLFLEDKKGFLTDKLDKEDIPENINNWIKQCGAKEGIYETKFINNGKINGWIYCNKGKKYFWNIKDNENELQLYLYDATKEKGENTLIYYEIPNSYTKINVYINNEAVSYTN